MLEYVSSSCEEKQVTWCVTVPKNWDKISFGEQTVLISNFVNNVRLARIGLLNETSVDFSYLDISDARSKLCDCKRKRIEVEPLTPDELDMYFDECIIKKARS